MNHCYRLVWNDLSQGHVPAPECARSKGRTSGSAGKPCLAPLALLLAGALSNPAFAAPPAANALPTGGQVVAGQAGVAQSGSAMTVTQGSDKAILNWQTFDIGSQASVRFIQPSTSAVALNRVLSGEASQIYGKLSANGHVFLVNPAGVVFGAGSKVDVGGLVASTMDITNEDFLAGRLEFRRNGATGGISNQGEITAGDGGLVALLAPTVRNEGIVSARLGNVVLAAGDRVTLQAGAGGLLQVQLDPATVRTLVENKQLIVADGGQVLMTGKAADILSASVVANTGTVQANTLQEKDGRILLLADMQHGETRAAGTLQAKFVETSAATVNIDKNLKVDTGGGQWLIDPVNITIDQNKATAIAAALGSGNVTVSTSNGHTNPGENTANTGSDAGDIHIDAGISYSTNTLTLHADNDIHINAAITATNGGLTLQAGNTISATASVDVGRFTLQSGHWRQIAAMLPGFRATDFRLNYGSSFVRATGGDGSGASPYALTDVYGLQGISTQLGQSFTLAGDIDASGTLGWNGGAGFIPIGDHRTGDDASRFTGSFNGNGHTISNLTVKVSSPSYELFGNRYTYAGLFGVTGAGAWIRQVGLVNANISATGSSLNLAGGLVAQNGGSIVGVHVSGSVSAWGGSDNYVGALVGLSRGFGNISSVADSDASANVSASDGNKNRAGGLVGLNYGDITQSHASGNASASGGSDNYAGALAGANFGDGRIIRSHASGNASASHGGNTNYAGALVGHNNLDATIVNSYASGNANALGGSSSHAGGLAGVNSGGGSGGTGRIYNSYAMGNATASGASIENYAGGLVGTDWGSISQSYASGSASASGGASSSAGGLVGRHSGTGSITNAFYATADASGNAINNGGESSGGWSGNGHGVGKTRAQLMDSAIFSGWDTGIWSFGDGANVEGYEVGLPSLISVTRAQDLVRSTLFNGGWGTAANPYGITDWQQLSNIRNVLAASYSLSNNLDSTTAGYIQLAAATANGGAGFAPIGDNRSSSDASRFTGSFDGQGHTISDLIINRPSQDFVGLFGYAKNATLHNVGLVNGHVTGQSYVGGLVGMNYAEGGTARTSNVYATGPVNGLINVGGLVGLNETYGGTASIAEAYASGPVKGLANVGGLVGLNKAQGGGISSISLAYATGPVEGDSTVGGLVGQNYTPGGTASITGAYATGPVKGSSMIGGLVGQNSGGGIANAFYATTDASGNAINNGGESSGAWSGNGHGAGKTRAQLMDSATFSGWDTGIWSFGDGANVEGYEVGLPSLIRVTRTQDLVRSTLFNDGWGTAANPYGITDWQQLSNIRNVLAASYSLSNNLDSTTAGYTQLAAATANGGAGFAPIGDNRSSSDASRFTGSFDGQGHTISDLNVKVSSPSGSSTLTYAGLFGVAGTGAQIRRIGLVNAGVSASGGNSNLAGALVGYNLGGSISDSYAGGSVSASGSDGSNNHAGGLVGINTSGGSITNSYATGSASALSDGPSTNYAGGLAGINHGRIANSYATGNAVAAGGHDSINYAGGLASLNNNGGPDGRISDSYASGSAVATGGNDSSNHAGGLIGLNNDSADGSITRSFYATTDANGNAINNGGNAGTGWSGNANGVGKTLAELKQAATFAAWGTAIDSQGGGSALWRIYDGHTTPLLRSWLKPITVTASGSDKTYDGTAATGTATYHTDVAGAVLDGNLNYATTSKNAGTYRVADSSLTMDGLYSGQQGYDIRYDTSATLTISKANLTVSTGDVSKTYDGTAAANGTATVTGGQLFGGDTLSGGSFTFADKNAGNGKSVTVSNVTVGDGNGGGNYAISYIANTNSRIDKANLTISTGNVTKSYDGTTAANGTATVADGRLFGGDSLSGGSFAFADKNAGSGKTVSVLGVTVQDGNGGGNYNVSYADNTGSTIDKATLTVSANSTRKTPGDTLIFQGTEFTTGSGQLKNGETVTNVMLVSDGAPASAQTGSYRIEASDVQGENGFVVGNYDITYVNGTLTVAVATGSGGSMANPGMPSGGSLAQALQSHVAAPEEKAKRTQRQAMGADQAPNPQQLVSASPYLTMTPGYIRIRGQVDEE